MNTSTKLNVYYDNIISNNIYKSKKRLKFHLKQLYGNYDFSNKNALDIGGGDGLHAFYMGLKGATNVINLEPEADGSTKYVSNKFKIVQTELGLNQVKLIQNTFQGFNSDGMTFDFILLHNSINHLDEEACVTLLNDSKSREIYIDLFKKLYDLTRPGGQLIICDCSRYNFFDRFKIKNFFVPSIEWEKHQSPKVWSEIAMEVGFVNPQTKWTSFNTLGQFGRIFTGNKLVSYFLNSHFQLKLHKQ